MKKFTLEYIYFCLIGFLLLFLIAVPFSWVEYNYDVDFFQVLFVVCLGLCLVLLYYFCLYCKEDF